MSGKYQRAWGLIFLGTLLFCSTAFGQIVRITDLPGNWRNPAADLKGKNLVYRSQPGGDLFLQDLKRGTVTLIATDAGDPRVSAGGKWIVFTSDGDLTGGNADGNEEIFLHEIKTGTTTQITDTQTVSSKSPSIDKKGRLIAFLSEADLAGNNADANEEVFLYAATTNSFTQVTATTNVFENDNPALVPNGKHLYFDSDANLAGANADGNREIFRYEVRSGLLEQMTSTTDGDNEGAAPNKNGKVIAFQTDSSDILTQNPDDGEEVVLLDVKKNVFRQLTDTDNDSSDPAISGNGKVVTFESNGDPTGNNADGSKEIFMIELKSKSLIVNQITDGAQTTRSRRASLDNAGKRVYFESDADLTGQGAGEDKIFVFER